MEISFRKVFFVLLFAAALLSVLSRVLSYIAQHSSFQDRNTSRRLARLATIANALPSVVFRVLNVRNFILLLLFIILAQYLNFDVGAFKAFLAEIVGGLNDVFEVLMGLLS